LLPSASIDPERIATFSKLMRDLLDNGETPARKAYLPTLVGAIIVGDKSVKIVGSKEAVRAAILGKPSPLQNVRGLGPDSNVRPSDLVWCTIPIDFIHLPLEARRP
jgi:hypothetical protein